MPWPVDRQMDRRRVLRLTTVVRPSAQSVAMMNMNPNLKLVFAIHNHQPVGNFDGVFEDALRDSYRPFLEVLQDYPEIRVVWHTSGSLMEWLVEKRPEFLDEVREFVERGQIEILGGPFYEPIMACIPRRDRIGQIRAYTACLNELFGTRVRGMWVPERVWEPSFVGDLVEAGIEYTLLDDYHFRCSGLPESELHGYYLTEDGGRTLKIFPDSEPLRYLIPFSTVEQTMEALQKMAREQPGTVVTFGDDGEKFGVWPGTKDHVYRDGWLRRFFDAVIASRDWLTTCTLAEAVQETPPVGTCYLPDASYREMTEWAMPTDKQMQLRRIEKQLQDEGTWDQVKPFVRGGNWRNFLVKYPESKEMYARMWDISRKLALAESQLEPGQDEPPLLAEARRSLYRGQCNCPYWHGSFGGLYLPHLRNAIYHHLIAADNALEQLAGRPRKWVDVSVDDYNYDGRKEVTLSNQRVVALVAPARGGHLYELDLRAPRHNLLATLNRRPEPYHQRILDSARLAAQAAGDGLLMADSAGMVHCKQPDLDKAIIYDEWPRKMLVDHFLRPGSSREAFARSEGEIGDFVQGAYEAKVRRSEEFVELEMTRLGYVGENTARVTKTIHLNREKPSEVLIRYRLSELAPTRPVHFAIEFNFAGMAAGAQDRYFYDGRGQQLGQLQTIHELVGVNRFGLVDEWLGVDASLELSRMGSLWAFPIQTVSQSEGGFELVHQSCTVVPRWEFIPDPNGTWSVDVRLTLDTSMVDARQLREAAAAT